VLLVHDQSFRARLDILILMNKIARTLIH
jgi:hypothetical protein